jgi:hypothetical protein
MATKCTGAAILDLADAGSSHTTAPLRSRLVPVRNTMLQELPAYLHCQVLYELYAPSVCEHVSRHIREHAVEIPVNLGKRDEFKSAPGMCASS